MANAELNHDTIHYLRKTIRSLTFEYKLDHNILYDVIAECKFGERMFGKKYGECGDYNKEKDNDNISDRVKRIMRERVMYNPQDIKETNPDPYSKPKMYDGVMETLQINLYNKAIVLLGFPQITDVYSDEFWKMGLQIDGATEMDMDALSIIAPYAFVGERREINFLELILLSAITLSNKRAEKVKHKGEAGFEAYALRQFKNIKEPLFSKQLYEALVMTFMYSLCQEIVKKYDEIRIPYIKRYLVPPKYKNRKDAELALRTHLKKVEAWDEERIVMGIKDAEQEHYLKPLMNIYDLETIVFLAESLLYGSKMKKNECGFYVFESYKVATIFKGQAHKVNQITVSSYEFEAASQIAEIVKVYIDNAIICAGEMLSSLEEAAIVDTPSIMEFFEKI